MYCFSAIVLDISSETTMQYFKSMMEELVLDRNEGVFGLSFRYRDASANIRNKDQ